MYTEINGQKSMFLGVSYGSIPGAILILFLIYINYINNYPNLNMLCLQMIQTAYIKDLIIDVNIQRQPLYYTCNKLSQNKN